MTSRKDQHRQRWLTNFELMVNELRPDTHGKIQWDTAIFFYNKGLVSDEAARKYVESLT